MMPFERYCQLYERIDPADPLVSAEIANGMRWSYGLTDIHHHLPRLRELAKGNVLEIGVRFGASTAALLAGVEEKGGHVWSVDTDSCDFARSLFEGHLLWTFMKIDSKELGGPRWFFPGGFDLVFIDGDHSYEGVLADLMNFGPRTKIIALHDANRRTGTPEVLAAIGYYLKHTNRHKRARIYPESHGLAVLT